MMALIEFLDLYPKKNTKKAYRQGITVFLSFIYGIERTRIISNEKMAEYERYSIQYLNEGRNYTGDLLQFVISQNIEIAPKTLHVRIAAVREWFNMNDILIPPREWKRIRSKMPNIAPRTVEREIDHETLKMIMHHMSIKGKAFFLLLSSSGMRVGEALQLTQDDIDLTASPATIYIRGENTKSGNQRITFITEEAVLVLTEWLKVRGGYMESSANRNNGLIGAGVSRAKPENDPRLFPYTHNVVHQMWITALTNAGMHSRDPGTGRATMTPHSLRKFFISQLSLVISKEIVETLAGHTGYLTDAYRRYPRSQLAAEYKRGEPQLTIQTPQEIKEIQTEFRQKMQAHSEILESIVQENIHLKKRLDSVEEIQRKMDSISQVVLSHPYLAQEEESPE